MGAPGVFFFLLNTGFTKGAGEGAHLLAGSLQNNVNLPTAGQEPPDAAPAPAPPSWRPASPCCAHGSPEDPSWPPAPDHSPSRSGRPPCPFSAFSLQFAVPRLLRFEPAVDHRPEPAPEASASHPGPGGFSDAFWSRGAAAGGWFGSALPRPRAVTERARRCGPAAGRPRYRAPPPATPPSPPPATPPPRGGADVRRRTPPAPSPPPGGAAAAFEHISLPPPQEVSASATSASGLWRMEARVAQSAARLARQVRGRGGAARHGTAGVGRCSAGSLAGPAPRRPPRPPRPGTERGPAGASAAASRGGRRSRGSRGLGPQVAAEPAGQGAAAGGAPSLETRRSLAAGAGVGGAGPVSDGKAESGRGLKRLPRLLPFLLRQNVEQKHPLVPEILCHEVRARGSALGTFQRG